MNVSVLYLTLLFQSVISLFGSALLVYWLSWQHGLSFLVGSGLMGFNWWLLIHTWSRILGKKSIALAISIIVIKWTLFGTICILLARMTWVMPTWLMLGIASVLVSAMFAGLGSKRLKTKGTVKSSGSF